MHNKLGELPETVRQLACFPYSNPPPLLKHSCNNQPPNDPTSPPGGAPMSLLTLCRSMYSDMSSRMMASCYVVSGGVGSDGRSGRRVLMCGWGWGEGERWGGRGGGGGES